MIDKRVDQPVYNINQNVFLKLQKKKVKKKLCKFSILNKGLS